MRFNNWSLKDLFCPKHTFSPKDLNIYHWHFENMRNKASSSILFQISHFMSIMLIAHSSELKQLFNCHNINAGTHFENPSANNLDLQVKMCCTPNKLFLGKKDLTAAYLTYSKIKTFFRCAYLNTLDVFKFYESRQCCTTNSFTFHNLICFFPFCNSLHLQNCMQFSMCNTCTILYYPF